MNREQLKSLASWGKFVAWTLLISGVINAVFGLFVYVVGAIPGVITFIMGLKLLSASKNAERLAYDVEDERALYDLIGNFLSYFKIQGIMLIISFVLLLLFMVLMLAGVYTGLEEYANY